MTEIQCPVSWTPYEHQLGLLQAMYGIRGKPQTRKKRAFLVWSRQWGKDTVCGIYMFQQALQYPGNYFYIFPFQTMARKAFWEKVDPNSGRRLIEQIPEEAIEGINNQEMLIRFKNGSTIRIIGLDSDPNAARGISPKMVVFSEAAFISPEVIANMEAAINMNDATVIWNTTPNGRNHAYKMWTYAKTHPEIWYTSFIQSQSDKLEGYVPHPNITDQYLYDLVDSGRMTQEDVDREYGCNFSTELRGSYYSEQINKARASGRIGLFPYNDSYPVNTYWDLGGADDTAIWFGQPIGDTVRFIDYLEGSGRDPLEDVLDLKEKGYVYELHVLPHDAAHRHKAAHFKSLQNTYQELLISYGVSGDVLVLDKPSSVQEGITAVRRRFNKYYFNEETTSRALEKLELYHKKYDKNRQVFLPDPQHDASSHCADALRSEAGAESLSRDPFFSMNESTLLTDFNPFSR